MICLSETFLDSFILTNGERCQMKGYKVIRADNSIDSERGNMSICYNEIISVRSVEAKNLDECVTSEVSIKSKRRYLV